MFTDVILRRSLDTNYVQTGAIDPELQLPVNSFTSFSAQALDCSVEIARA